MNTADRMLAWLNRRFAERGPRISYRTLLFEEGLIDSIRILEIIAWVEEASGRAVPDHEIRMDRFASVERIATHFLDESDVDDR